MCGIQENYRKGGGFMAKRQRNGKIFQEFKIRLVRDECDNFKPPLMPKDSYKRWEKLLSELKKHNCTVLTAQATFSGVPISVLVGMEHYFDIKELFYSHALELPFSSGEWYAEA
jgi:hypothetical protein